MYLVSPKMYIIFQVLCYTNGRRHRPQSFDRRSEFQEIGHHVIANIPSMSGNIHFMYQFSTYYNIDWILPEIFVGNPQYYTMIHRSMCLYLRFCLPTDFWEPLVSNHFIIQTSKRREAQIYFFLIWISLQVSALVCKLIDLVS